MKSIITVKCPECRGLLEIDVAHQKVLSHKRFVDLDKPEKDKAEIFDDAMKRVGEREDLARAAFEKAQDDMRHSEERLDALFGEVKKKIDEERERGGGEEEKKRRDLFWD